MTSRERVFAALAHKQPDRCPVDYWATPEVNEKLFRYFGVNTEDALLDALEADMQTVKPALLTAAREISQDGSYYDARGIRVKPVRNDYNTYLEFVGASLGEVESAKDLEKFERWQSVDMYDWEHFAQQIKSSAEKRVLRLMTGGIFETAIALRGYERFMMDLVLNPEVPMGIMERITDFLCAFVRKTMECGAGEYIDIIYTYDDLASQNSLLVSHDMLETFVYPFHRKLNSLIRSYGKKIMYHSCGAVYSEIETLAGLPIDILNPLQPLAKGMDGEKIKEKYGDRLAFHGGICIQQLLPYGTPEEVAEGVRETIKTLGRGGGYIMASAHHLQNDTSVENILAMYRTDIR